MKKILVIEDNTEVRENICEILELAGYEAYSASNGKTGVEKATSLMPDLILCDVMMPELDGFGVLKILSNNRLTHGIPFIFLTAKAEKDDFRKGMGLGADDYITKPFDDTQLLEAIEIRIKRSDHNQKPIERSDHGIQRFFSEAKAKEDFEHLSTDKELRFFRDKDIIYNEGSEARWLYFIVTGRVKCVQMNDFGKELITHIYDQGDFFGYFPILKESAHSDAAMSLGETKVRLIPAQDFRLMLFNNRDFAAQFIKLLANEAEDTEQKLIEMAYSSVRRKVAQALLKFASNKEPSPKDSSIKLQVSRDNLASAAGTAKETLIRTLSDFKAEGLLEIDAKTITIIDKDRIESMPQ